MKDSGEPDRVGEVLHQAGATATAVETVDGLAWEVHQHTDGTTTTTKRLAHTEHWHPQIQVGRARADVMTLYYPDVSNNNWGSVQDLYNFLGQLKAQGFAGVCHKRSEGNYYRDPYCAPCETWCQQNHFPFIDYHYLTTDDPGSQAQNYLGAGGHTNTMFDDEANSGDINNFWACVNAFNGVGVNVQLAYLPNWYWRQIGSPDLSSFASNGILLVSSAYPDGAGFASVVYANGGGAHGEGWNAYGGAVPSAWQFTDNATISGISGVDCNAYEGADINVLFGTLQTPIPTPAPGPMPPPPTPTGTQIILSYDHSTVMQENYWDCGPASAAVVLDGSGVVVSQDTLIDKIGTTTDGTNSIAQILPVLNSYLPNANYQLTWMPNDPPTQADVAALWAAIQASITAGYGLEFNWVAPPDNYPIGIMGSQSPDYGRVGGTVYHYVAGMGFDIPNQAVWIADPGFPPFGYWVSIAQCALLIAEKGYLYAGATVPAPTPTPTPTRRRRRPQHLQGNL